MKTHILKIAITFFTILLMNAATLMAQHDHGGHNHGGSSQSHQPPHGGQIKEAGKYHIEMLVNMLLKQDKITLYLLKSNLKLVANEGITGTITIKYKDGTIVTDTLLSRGDDYFVAQLKKTEPFTCTVKFQVKGKTVSAVFSYSGLGLNTKSVYTCPMHPEIEQEKSGTCPKCGMELLKK
jgi:hypothetical protein